MSKQLGNSPDPLELIAKYGADGVRMGMMLSAPAGNDILFDDALCEQGRNFNNKIWNAFRLLKGWEVIDDAQPETSKTAVRWFDAQLRQTASEVADLFSKYRLSEALMAVYKLFWDEFSAWYLEMIKPAYGQPIDRTTYDSTLSFFNELLKMLHPFMPFITEELWQHLYERKNGQSIMLEQLTQTTATDADRQIIKTVEAAKAIVSSVRTIRNQKCIAPKEILTLEVIGENPISEMNGIIIKMGNLDKIDVVTAKTDNASTFMVGTTEFAVPLGHLIDTEAEIKKQEAELTRLKGFLAGITKKLSNEKFTANAPANVVELERKKQADAESKISALEESLKALKAK